MEGEVVFDDVAHDEVARPDVWAIPLDEHLYLGDPTYHKVLIDTNIISIEDRTSSG